MLFPSMSESNAYEASGEKLEKDLIGENLFLLLESIYIGYLYPYRRRARVMLQEAQWCLFWTK